MPSHSSLPELRFVCLMVAIYLGLEQLYKLVPDALLKETLYGLLFVEPGAMLVNLLSPGEHAVADGNLLSSSRALLAIVRGCDGSGVLFIALGAVLAFPASWPLRAAGALGGAVLVYLLNMLRLVGLYFIEAYRGDWFQALHTYFVPSLMIVVVCLCFMQWAALASPRDSRAH